MHRAPEDHPSGAPASGHGAIAERYAEVVAQEQRAAAVARVTHCIEQVQAVEAAEGIVRGNVGILAATVTGDANEVRRRSAAHAAEVRDAVDPAALARAERGEEFDRIAAMAHVARIAVEGGALVVTTADIVLARRGQTYHLGPYEVRIGHDARTAKDVSVQSVAGLRSYNGYQHPHVYGDGEVCWGNVGPLISSALVSGNLDVVIQLAIAVLQTAGHEQYWDVAQELAEQRALRKGARAPVPHGRAEEEW